MAPVNFAGNSTVDIDINPCAACPVRELTVCCALEEAELSRMADIVRTRHLDPHKTLFSEGDEAGYVYNVTAGTVKLYKLLPDGRRQITGFLFTGDFLGLSMHERYAYTAETVTPVSLCQFPRRQFEQMLQEFPKLQQRMFTMASNELEATQDQMLLLGRKTAKEKVVSFLLGLSRRLARRGQKGNPVPIPMSRSDIADYLGLTTETVSRTFTALKSRKVIRLLEGNKVDLVDHDALLDLADGG